MKIEGTVVEVSEEGDLITDISAEQLAACTRDSQSRIVVDDEHETFGIYESPEGQPSMTLLAIQTGNLALKLHWVGDSAAMMLGIKAGASVRVVSQ